MAIDGQHRLTALKRLKADSDRATAVGLSEWRIPVVILGFRGIDGEGDQPGSLLEAVRRIFVHINREAKQPNRARTILLTDESVNAIATQELLQRSHGNDVLPSDERQKDILPLLFYDWRGEEEDGRRLPAPAAVKSTEEVHDWIADLILGQDFSPEQGAGLGVNPTSELKHIYAHRQLPPRLTPQLRALLNEDLVPAIAFVLESFTPYREYCESLRKLEQRTCSRSDSGRHAFDLLRFGQHGAEQDQVEAVLELYKQLQSQISLLRLDLLHRPLDLDIGLRGIMAALGELRPHYQDTHGSSSWTEYAQWFVPLLNELYAEGWLEQTQGSLLSEHQRHIVADHADTTINYRMGDAAGAFGALISMLILAKDFTNSGGDEVSFRSQFDAFSERLRTTLTAGYKKELRPDLKKKYPDGGKPLTEAVRKAAEASAGEHMTKLESTIPGLL